MQQTRQEIRPIVVAGHVCLDLTPDIPPGSSLPKPGALLEVGALAISTGGAVANTGGALAKLGVPVRMVARVGDDFLGQRVGDLLRSTGSQVHLNTDVSRPTSYSIVIAPHATDRSFLHAPGANHGFDPDDVAGALLHGAAALHFGYPPAMAGTYLDGGVKLAAMFARAHDMGLITSLDLCWPDLNGPCSQVDWPRWLARVLPHVSVFCPSLDELRAVLKQTARPAASEVPELARAMLDLGCAAVMIKLGDHGVYLQTGARTREAHLPAHWQAQRLHAPCFETTVVTANGAGDCTIAGLLASITRGHTPQDALTHACAVGACSVEAADATSGVRSWDATLTRIRSGWKRRETPVETLPSHPRSDSQ